METTSPFKILVDENLSRRLISILEDAFPESTHVSTENLLKTLDQGIWNFALQKEYCILTKDWDYKFMSVALGCPPKVIRLNCGNKTTAHIANLLQQKFEVIKEFLTGNDDCYLEIE